MKREIKFRAKRVDNNEWIYGYFGIDHNDKSYIFLVEDVGMSIGKSLVQYEVVPETVGQFTGLTDKNGLDIYEGDIIRTERNTAVVSFGNKEYIIKIYDKSDMIEINGWLVTNKNGHSETLDSSFCEGEVIGNIHSNPELITKNK